MKNYGQIAVIKRTGQDSGIVFPLSDKGVTIGRDLNCDIRVQMPKVSRKHCQIVTQQVGKTTQVLLHNLSKNSIMVNTSKLARDQLIALDDGDVFCILDREFRYDGIAEKENRYSLTNVTVQDVHSEVKNEYNTHTKHRKISIEITSEYTKDTSLGKRKRSMSIDKQINTEKISKKNSLSNIHSTEPDNSIWSDSTFSSMMGDIIPSNQSVVKGDVSPLPLEKLPESAMSPFADFKGFNQNVSSMSFIDPDASDVLEENEPKDPAIAIYEGDRVFQVGQLLKKQVGKPKTFSAKTPNQVRTRPNSILKARPQTVGRKKVARVSFATNDLVLVTPMKNSSTKRPILYSTPCKTRSPLTKTTELPILDRVPEEFLDDFDPAHPITTIMESDDEDDEIKQGSIHMNEDEDGDSEEEMSDDCPFIVAQQSPVSVSPHMLQCILDAKDDDSNDDSSESDVEVTGLISCVPIPQTTPEAPLIANNTSTPTGVVVNRKNKSLPFVTDQQERPSKRFQSLSATGTVEVDPSALECVTPTFSRKAKSMTPEQAKQQENEEEEGEITPTQAKPIFKGISNSVGRIGASKFIPFHSEDTNNVNKEAKRTRRTKSEISSDIVGDIPVPIALPSPKPKRTGLKDVGQHVSTPLPPKRKEDFVFSMTPPSSSLPISMVESNSNTPLDLFSTRPRSKSSVGKKRKPRRSSTSFNTPQLHDNSTPSTSFSTSPRPKIMKLQKGSDVSSTIQVIDNVMTNLPDTSVFSPLGGIPVGMSTPSPNREETTSQVSTPLNARSTPLQFTKSVANMFLTPVRAIGNLFSTNETEVKLIDKQFALWKEIKQFLKEKNHNNSLYEDFYNPTVPLMGFVSLTDMYDHIQDGAYPDFSAFEQDMMASIRFMIQQEEEEEDEETCDGLHAFSSFVVSLFTKAKALEGGNVLDIPAKPTSIPPSEKEARDEEIESVEVKKNDVEMESVPEKFVESVVEETAPEPQAEVFVLAKLVEESRDLAIPSEDEFSGADFFSANSEMFSPPPFRPSALLRVEEESSRDSAPSSPATTQDTIQTEQTAETMETEVSYPKLDPCFVIADVRPSVSTIIQDFEEKTVPMVEEKEDDESVHFLTFENSISFSEHKSEASAMETEERKEVAIESATEAVSYPAFDDETSIEKDILDQAEENEAKVIEEAREVVEISTVEPVEESAIKESTAVEESAVEPSAVEPSAMEPSAVEPSAMEESAVEKSAVEPSAVEESAMEESAVEPSAVEESAVEESAMEESAVEESAVGPSAVEESAVEESAVEPSAMEESTVEPPAVEEEVVEASPAIEESVAEKSAMEEAVEFAMEATMEEAVVDASIAGKSAVEELVVEPSSKGECAVESSALEEYAMEESAVEPSAEEESVEPSAMEESAEEEPVAPSDVETINQEISSETKEVNEAEQAIALNIEMEASTKSLPVLEDELSIAPSSEIPFELSGISEKELSKADTPAVIQEPSEAEMEEDKSLDEPEIAKEQIPTVLPTSDADVVMEEENSSLEEVQEKEEPMLSESAVVAEELPVIEEMEEEIVEEKEQVLPVEEEDILLELDSSVSQVPESPVVQHGTSLDGDAAEESDSESILIELSDSEEEEPSMNEASSKDITKALREDLLTSHQENSASEEVSEEIEIALSESEIVPVTETVDYQSWTCKLLRDELKKRNLETKGLKKALVARLEGSDENGNESFEKEEKKVEDKEEEKEEEKEDSSELLIELDDSSEEENKENEEPEVSEEPKVDYNSWTCVVLRKELKTRKLETKGVKKVLVSRLEEDDASGSASTPSKKATAPKKKVKASAPAATRKSRRR